MRNLRLNCAWLKLARTGVDVVSMQRILTAALVLLAVAFSAGGVAISVRADSQQSSAAAPAPASTAAQDRCSLVSHPRPVHINAAAAARAAQDDMVPLNTQGYNYNAYEGQWRPEVPTAAPAGSDPVPASPAKP